MFKLIGVITVVLIIFFVLMGVMRKFLTIVKSDKATDFMPKLIPVSIPTRAQPGGLHRLVAYVTEVRKWEVAENWYYKKGDETYVIPKGFVFDGASIPRPLWALLSPIGLLLVPGLIHDFGYRYDYIWCVDEASETGFSKAYVEAGQAHWDGVFYEVGEEVNGMPIITGIAWLALASMGSFAWNDNRKRNEPEVFPYEPKALDDSEESNDEKEVV